MRLVRGLVITLGLVAAGCGGADPNGPPLLNSGAGGAGGGGDQNNNNGGQCPGGGGPTLTPMDPASLFRLCTGVDR